MGSSLRKKIMLPVFLFLFVLFLMSQSYQYFMVYEREKGNLLANANILTSIVVCRLNKNILEKDKEKTIEALSMLAVDEHIVKIRLDTADDREFVTLSLHDDIPVKLSQTQLSELSEKRYLFGKDFTYLYVPVLDDGTLVGKMYIATNNTPFKKVRKSVDINLLYFFVRIALVGGFLYWILDSRILKRIGKLRNAMQSYFENKDTDNRLSVTSNDEIGHLVKGFNEMLDRLSERDKQLTDTINKLKVSGEVFNNSHDGVMVLNCDGKITIANPAVEPILGYSVAELVGKKVGETLRWKSFESVLPSVIDAVNKHGYWQGEICEKHKNGHAVPMQVKVYTLNPELCFEQSDIALIICDLTDIKEKERLEHLAHHDSLTGLANRIKLHRVFEEFTRTNWSNETQLAVIYIDLDEFKEVNDTYGHHAGDVVLKHTAACLLSHVRSSDLVVRMAGDEFVILVFPTEYAQIQSLVQRLLRSISEDIQYQNNVMSVGASIGVYLTSNLETLTLESILKRADSAMYQAKMSGKGKYVIDEGNIDE